MAQSLAEKHAEKEGAKAAKLALQKAQCVIGPMISVGWDFYEVVYYGGSDAEGVMSPYFPIYFSLIWMDFIT
ncbi:hypothetical protein AHAS_Ahas15G0163700 [Arachis hypogaea]